MKDFQSLRSGRDCSGAIAEGRGSMKRYLSIFNEKKEEIYGIYRNCKLLDEKQLKGTLAYYDQFYDIINDPRQVRSNFYESCPLSHQHLHEK